jgi:Leucine-rich repeat (LRR) protein
MALGLGLFQQACTPVRSASYVKVVNGQSVADGSPVRATTVGLVSLKDDGSKDKVFCTAVIVAYDALLTATQCLDSAKDAGVKWGVLLDHPKLGAPQVVAVKSSQHFSAAGSRDYPSLNLSVVRLMVPIDPASGYLPAEILRNPAGLQTGTEVLIAGYGRQSSQCLDATRCTGVLLEAKSSVDSFHDANHLLSTLLIRARQDQGSVCFGDAGGPAFVQVNDRYYLAGIASGSLRRGLSELSAAKNDSLVCENGLAAFTFPGDYVPWMERSAALKFATPSVGNLPRGNNPAIENSALTSKPALAQDWVGWLAFSQHQDPAFSTVSYLQQKLLDTERARTDPNKLSELDFYLRPIEAHQRAQSTTELVMQAEGGMQPLTSIEPLAPFVSLTQLEINGMAIVDFTPLSQLLALRSIKITGHKSPQNVAATLPNLGSLGSLFRLENLELDQVGTETLRALDSSKLLGLRTLTLVGNGQPLFIPKAPALDTLIISNADLSNPDLLVGLPASITTLKITGSRLTSVDFVSNLVNLKTLDLSGNQIKDFTRINDLKKLTSVKAVGNPSTSKVCGTPAAAVCEYDQITNPVTLDEYCINFLFQESGKVYAAAIQSLSEAAAMNTPKSAVECADLNGKLRLKRKLELTGTGGTAPVDMSPVAAIRSLNNLALRNFGLIDVRPLTKLINLDVLDLSQNLIVDPKPLEALPELVELNLSQNMIADMKGFTHLNLKRLMLDGNQMTSAQSFGELPELRTLSMANMPGFKDVKGVGRMGKLKNLDVGNTDVTDLKTLEPAVGLAIDAPEAAVVNGCPVLLGSCVTDGSTPMSRSGPVPGLKPGQRVQVNPTAEVHLPGLSMSMKLE